MIRTGLAIVCSAIFLSAPVWAGDDKPAKSEHPVLDRLVERVKYVVPKDLEEKLDLTDDQKKQLNKLQMELNLKNMQIMARAMALKEKIESPPDKGSADKEPSGGILLEGAGVALDLARTHREITGKFRDILTDDQKKIYDEARTRPRPRRDRPRKDG